MKRTAFQHPTILDGNGNVVQQGTYGKESPLVNSTNDGVLDYINNNLEALHDNINGSRIYVASKDALPATGDLSAMYIAEDTGKWYLWDGTKYIETDNARKIADEAIAARDAAKASQTAAKASETAAKASENNAAASKTAAETSASDAASSASDATTQANTAKAWATSTTSPDGAADTDSTTGKTQSARSWAMYSKDRATASATSASASEASANAAKTSEENAANSKTAAAASANSAADSAKAAETSANDAANSAREQQADWNVTDSTSKAYIKNKPDVVLKSGLASSVSTSSLTVTGNTSVPTANVGNATSTIASTAFVSKSLDQVEEAVAALYVPKAELASSVSTTSLTVTGETSVPTANEGNSSNTIASTEFVAKSIAKLVDSAPESLNTLHELAKALGNDPNFATTILNELGKKLNSTEAENTYVKQGGMNLWNALHNNTTSNLNGLTNAQWNALGFFIRYFNTTNNFENQPSQYGQLINISANTYEEATQLFIEQLSGKIYFRGGNGAIAMKDVKFKEVAYWNDDKHLVFPNGAEMWVF